MDEELRDLLRNIFFVIVIFIIFGIIFGFVLLNRFGGKDSYIEKKIMDKKDMVLFVFQNNCDNCKEIKKRLKSHYIYYDSINTSTERRYQSILHQLNLSKKDIEEPTLLYVEDGQVVSILTKIENLDDLESFIEYNNLSN